MRRQSAGSLNHSFGSWHSLPDAAPRIEWLPVAETKAETTQRAAALGNNDVDVRSVKSGMWTYEVNFNVMNQTNVEHPAHKVRQIRRVFEQ